MFSTDSSGDYLADRRFALAMQLYERGDYSAALDVLQQAEELAPDWPPLPFRRGEILMETERRDEALDAFKAYMLLDPQDRMGATVKLTLLGAMPQPETLPAPYVEALFDDYAPRFETALVENLSYCVPQLLAGLVEKHRPRDETTAEYILDLGCGTGLAAEAFMKRAAWLEGIDLSQGMIDMAAVKGLYNKLEQGDILTILQKSATFTPCQLALAADVLVYIGELGTLFTAIARRMAPGGLFAFSLQKLPAGETRPYLLGEDHRYAHNLSYIESSLRKAGLSVLAQEEHAIRQDRGVDLSGYIVLAEKSLTGAAILPPTGPIADSVQAFPEEAEI